MFKWYLDKDADDNITDSDDSCFPNALASYENETLLFFIVYPPFINEVYS